MIIGKVEDFFAVKFENENINKAFEFIKTHDLLNLPEGKTIIDGDNLWVNRSSYVGKNIEDCKLESHEKYLDLQLVIKGKEGMGYVDKARYGIEVTLPYDEKKDKANYKGELDGIIYLHDHQFALVWPNDLHMPLIKANDEMIEKAVFKIKIK